MNLQYLRYALEVERTGSITQAAKNLFMSQPNLSRAIKDLEKETGTTVFRRSPQGVEPTERGLKLLNYGKTIVSQIDEFESLFIPQKSEDFRLHLSVPRASYISAAFIDFFRKIGTENSFQITFKETDSITAMQDVSEGASELAVIRYQEIYEPYFLSMFEEYNLSFEVLWNFRYCLVMSKEHPLACCEDISYHQLSGFVEITHVDLQVPSIAYSQIKRDAGSQSPKKRIYVYERGSQYDFLKNIPGTYMWVSPIPQEMLDFYGLVQKPCSLARKENKDVLLYSKKHALRDKELLLIEAIQSRRDIVSGW